jgi:hypothetical protein
MRTWMIGIGLVLLAGPIWADRTSNDRSEMEGARRIAAGSEATGAIEGQVSIGPVRSVERKGVPNQRPYQARIAVLDLAGREVAVAESDSEGKFRIALPPGTYVLRPESPGLYPRASEQRVTVGSNSVSRVEIVYDSGKR